MTEKIAKPEIIIQSHFHGIIQGVNFSNQMIFNSVSWFLGEFEDNENAIKRKMLLETEFIEALVSAIETNYFKYDYSLADTENGLYDLFETPVSKMEVDIYSRQLASRVQESFIPFIQKLYKQLGGKI